MSKAKLIKRMYREVHSLDRRLLPTTAVQAVIDSIKPFINIYFSARLITLLTQKADTKEIITNIAFVLSINIVIFFLASFLNNYNENHRMMMLDLENKKVEEKLYNADYALLNDSEFKELLHRHEEAGKSRWARLPYFMWTTLQFTRGVLTTIISFIIIIPLLKVGFVRTGNTFFERPLFIITIVAAIAVMAVIILIVASKINKSYLEANEKYAELDRIFYSFIDILGDYKTGKEIRLYKEQNLIDNIATQKILTDGEITLRKISMRTAKSSSFIAILGALVGFGVYLFIGVKGLFGQFGIGSLVLYCGSFMQIISGIMMFANTLGKLKEILPLARDYFKILEAESTMVYGNRELDLTNGFEIEFNNVSFKYPKSDNYALKHIILKIRGGEKLAVVGRNGSGKTTFIKLLCRLYDVDEGEILINGVNVKEYTRESLNALYSVVFQDYKILSLTVADNISASDECDKAKLCSALDKANINERIEAMPQKEKTYLYKDLDKSGVEISGGEAQKLALARALYKDSPIVILDEPTAALDPIAENEIYSRFNSFVENKTAIYISHRLSSCAFCDRIAVFDNAELVETGTHNELISANGRYAELWNAQAFYYN
ncbi:MAG: ABC transporter ATP-binding protein/permease [Clostridiales bacterium]|nr:ABC transporter ATP-binding protein/permease [Clostridiales bacterium]